MSWWLTILLEDHTEACKGEDIENPIIFDKRVFGSVLNRIIAVFSEGFKKTYFDRKLDSRQNLEDLGTQVARKYSREN